MENTSRARKTADIVLTISFVVLLFFCIVGFYTGIYIYNDFSGQTADELFFYLTTNSENNGSELVVLGILKFGIPFILTFAVAMLLIFGKKKKPIKVGKVQIFPIKHKKTLSTILCLAFLTVGLNKIGFFGFINNNIQTSTLIDNEYVNPENLVSYEGKKKNLILIEVESLEATMFTKEQGGGWDYEIIPELYSLLSEDGAIHFAVDGKVQGTPDISTTTWTTGALIAYTSGLPFKVPFSLVNQYSSESFMPGAYTLGDTLLGLGYKNVLFSGAETTFGGVSDYFTLHGDYDIIDIHNCEELGYSLPDSQKNEWGISDEALFEMAKKYLCEFDFSSPINLLISTIDTHMTCYTYESGNGFEGSETRFDNKVENAYATTSRVIGRFINWMKTTDYYDDTVIVIIGDHNNMFSSVCADKGEGIRGRYNVILNSSVQPSQNPLNRCFSPMDFYPTILAAMGMKIDGDRLGLGVNLLSEEKALTEKYGYNYFNKEINKKSIFYCNNIIK